MLSTNASGPTLTPINISRLEQELSKHPDRVYVQKLVHGLTFGFDTGLQELPTTSFECKNLQSSERNPDIVTDLLHSEVEKGYLIGPYCSPPFDLFRINPIGLVQGKYSKKYRIIVDLSAPHNDSNNASLNSLIDKSEYSLSYVRLDDAIAAIREFGEGTILSKTDIVDAFKLIPIAPHLWKFHGVKWKGNYYFYKRLCFGSRSSPKIFTLLSEAIHWIATTNYGIERLFYLLDDFLAVTRPTGDGYRTMALLTLIFGRLNIPLHPTKTVGPVFDIEYLGIFLNSVEMKAYLPLEKVNRISSLLQEFSIRHSVMKRELLSLLGHLNFASRVIVPGRSFVSYLLRVAASVKLLHHHVYLNQACLRDMAMWSRFLQQWNGISFFYDTDITYSADMELYTDASGIGYGGIFKQQWFSEYWPNEMPKLGEKDMSIAYMELVPIVTAVVLWSPQWSGKRILFHCDNEATVAIIKKGRSTSHIIMNLMRRLTWCTAKYHFIVHAQHVPGKQNSISDALSRFQFDRFRKLAPQAELHPTQIPPVKDLQLF